MASRPGEAPSSQSERATRLSAYSKSLYDYTLKLWNEARRNLTDKREMKSQSQQHKRSSHRKEIDTPGPPR